MITQAYEKTKTIEILYNYRILDDDDDEGDK